MIRVSWVDKMTNVEVAPYDPSQLGRQEDKCGVAPYDPSQLGRQEDKCGGGAE